MDLFNQNLDQSLDQNYSPVLWSSDGTIRPEIHSKLHKIGMDFVSTLEIEIPVIDLTITGSMASFNWHGHSDVDLHIITDLSDLDCNEDLAREYVRDESAMWNDKHNITIGGHEIEVYIQDNDEPHISSGVYSLLDNRWLKQPTQSGEKPSESEVAAKADRLRRHAYEAVNLVAVDPQAAYERTEALRERIRSMRKFGLRSGGEFSVENLAFKQLRNDGTIAALRDASIAAYDAMMSSN